MIELFDVLIKVLCVFYMVYLVYFGVKHLMRNSSTPKKDVKKFYIITYVFLALIILSREIEKFLSE